MLAAATVAASIFLIAGTHAASAAHHRGHYRHYRHRAPSSAVSETPFNFGFTPIFQPEAGVYPHRGSVRDGRPRAWCGWYMRKLMGVADRTYNLARAWAGYGHATSPHQGAIVVWPHHVGRIVGGCDGSICLIESGNDGHAVRTRERSIRGAIAFRE
jgi:hypothetical protein